MSAGVKKKKTNKCPNDLFISYINELKTQALKKGDKHTSNYTHAVAALKKYPLPLQNGAEAIIIQGIGKKICTFIDSKLAKDAGNAGLSPREFLERSRNVNPEWWNKLESIQNTKKGKDPPKVLKKRVVDYGENGPLSKRQTTNLDHTQRTNLTNWLTSNRCGTTVQITKKVTSLTEVVEEKSGSSPRNNGDVILVDDDDIGPEHFNKATSQKSPLPEAKQSPDNTSHLFSFAPNTFDIVLCIDTREINGSKGKKKLKDQLKNLKVNWADKNLQVGDFAWVAKEKCSNPRELVLDYIVERKCIADLAQSIPDGRFHEQKIRLKQCGITNVIYLVEDLKQIEHQSLPAKTLRQAVYNTQIVNKFHIKYTASIKETFQYLEMVTEKLCSMYSDKTLFAVARSVDGSPPLKNSLRFLLFDEFNSASSKHTKGKQVKSLFIRQLMQISGMSYDRAEVICEKYQTPKQLYMKYEQCLTVKEREKLVEDLEFGVLNKKIGKSISSSLYSLFS